MCSSDLNSAQATGDRARRCGVVAFSACEARQEILDHDTVTIMHNDAMVQGLSERPFMDDVEHWGVLTIGTGLGNARFSNRRSNED